MCIFCERFKNGDRDAVDFNPTSDETRDAEQCPSLRSKQRPATIITGFLGSGKTTFLNYLLSSPQVPPGLAVLINEFGDVSVDDRLLQTAPAALADEPILIPMPNGCLCCKIRGDLVDALLALAANEAVRHVVIEGSGLAPTLPVAQTFLEPRIQPSFRLTHIINVVDASRLAAQLADGGSYGKLVREQLALSSVTLLNKVDLVAADQRQKFVADLTATGSLVIPCRNSRVNVAQVLREQDWVERLLTGGPVTHLAGVWSLTVSAAGCVDADKAVAWLQDTVKGLGERLMRCKGILRQTVGPAVLIQGVGQHVEVTDAPQPSDKSFLVFIGVGEQPDQLQETFMQCLAGS